MLLFNSLPEDFLVQTSAGIVGVPRAPRFALMLKTNPISSEVVVAQEDGSLSKADVSCIDAHPASTYFSPEEQPGVCYLVPEAVALSIPNRRDLFCVGETRATPDGTVLMTILRPNIPSGPVFNIGDVLEEIPD